MHPIEKMALAIRRSRVFKQATPLWNVLRPGYVALLGRFGARGLERTINGTDKILILPELYNLSEVHEPQVWSLLMREIQPTDRIADVGASLGLYSIACGNRVKGHGKVFAFEPDPKSLTWLKEHVRLNGLETIVEVWPYAVGERQEKTWFVSGRDSESHMSDRNGQGIEVQCVTLDDVFADQALGLLKIDVEGFELQVLKGAQRLLADKRRAPRAIFIEVHPFAWEQFNVNSESLLSLLRRYGYEVIDMQGAPVKRIEHYGEVIARRL